MFGVRPTTYDPQLIVRHVKSGKLDFIAALHVDDIKVACPEHVFKEFIKCLEDTFGSGELEITKDNFTNCGVRHVKQPDGGYKMDQDQYVQALRPIVHKDLVGKKPEEMVNEQVSSLFLSLLMALAYALMTRVDLCIYVIALQRRTQSPSVGEVRRLNAIVRWAQKHPLCLTYVPMKCARHLAW